MNDKSDASQAIDDVVQALKLAGVTEDVIANQLLAKGCIIQLMNGVSADEELEVSLIGLARLVTHDGWLAQQIFLNLLFERDS